jgi:3',5'-nucleoside bisphosphate phosphatase
VRIDLHTHSTASDGTSSPTLLLHEARDAGLDVIGLADHDTTAGWDEAAHAAVATGVGLIRGTEVSTLHGTIGVHLLSLLQDPDEPTLAGAFAATRQDRDTRARRMVERIAVDFPLTWDDVLAQISDGRTVGRPHIADALVAAGIVPDRPSAFDTILSSRGPYYIEYSAPSTVDAVRMVRAAGGVPVLAHPGAQARGAILPDDAYEELAAAGLAGVEVYHRDNPAGQVRRLLDLARRHGLVVTGASDYHGTGKPNRLGENLTDPAVLDLLAEQGTTEIIASSTVRDA